MGEVGGTAAAGSGVLGSGYLVVALIHVIAWVFFFFKQKTAYEIKECDWSSDVCSSDL